MKEELINHLIETKLAIENDVLGLLSDQDKTDNYLYFATQVERMSLYMAEKSSNGILQSSQLSRNFNIEEYFELNRIKPIFEAEIKTKGLETISNRPLQIEPVFEKGLSKLCDSLLQIEQTHGSFIALLSLRRWAYSPDNKKGDPYRSRLAASYLGVLVPYLMSVLQNSAVLVPFLDWCGNRGYILTWCCERSLQTKEWGFNKKEFRNPPEAALPIHEAEAASYIKFFINKTADIRSRLTSQFAEMTIYLSLCLAAGRNQSNFYKPAQILKVSNQDMTSLLKIKGISHNNHTEIISDPWDLNCNVIKIHEHPIIINSRLGKAVDLLGRFTIGPREIENRLNEAYKVVGLSHSSGKICPRSFLFRPHIWEGIDTRL